MFRFTIRDLLWLSVVTGLGVAWWMDHSRYIGERVWMDRYLELKVETRSCEVMSFSLVQALKAKGYSVEPYSNYYIISPPLQPAVNDQDGRTSSP